jgi:uncharacterized protein (TIGR02231 family)
MHALASILILAVTPPKVSQVVVFPDRAQVTREEKVECSARAVASFPAIPPAADPSSFRAHVSTGTVEGLRSEERTRAETYAPEVKALDDKIRKLTLEQRALGDQQRRGSGAVQVASSYTDVATMLVSREMSDPAPNTKNWNGAFDAALNARQKAAQESVDLGVKIRDLEHQLEELRRQRGKLTTSGARREFFAEVLVACPAGKSATVELTYLVGGASWDPSYEARADEAGNAVDLSTFATVRQSTGEDWNGSRIILSTAVPRQDATPPQIAPLRLWAEERKPEKKVLGGRTEYHDHAEAAADESAPTTPQAPPAGTPSAGPRMRTASQGLSVQLAVPEPSDVPGDDTPSRLFVGKNRIKAKFALRTMPKLAPFAFRVADLSNSAPFPLLPGPLDAFRRGGLIARYPIERVAEGATFHLTFGIEESVRVKRIVVEEIQRDKGFFGTTRRFNFSYRFELGNYLPRGEELEVSDHIPVSELDDVKVAIDGKSTGGYELRADDGIVIWRVKMKSGEKRNVDLAFHVDVPSSYDTGSL